MSEQSKYALISFILSVVGFGFACGWWLGIIGVPLGIVSLCFGKKNDPETNQQPFMTFAKIARPVAIVDIVLGAVMFVVAIIVTIITAIVAAAGANA